MLNKKVPCSRHPWRQLRKFLSQGMSYRNTLDNDVQSTQGENAQGGTKKYRSEGINEFPGYERELTPKPPQFSKYAVEIAPDVAQTAEHLPEDFGRKNDHHNQNQNERYNQR